MDNPFPRHAANPTQNIDAIAKLEHEALGRRTITERVSEVITSLVGNMGFLLAQLILISGWILVNLHAIPGLKAFDPFPFGVLALLVSSEGVFLTVFVLCSSVSRRTSQTLTKLAGARRICKKEKPGLLRALPKCQFGP